MSVILAALITLLVVIWATDAAFERADAIRRFTVYIKTSGVATRENILRLLTRPSEVITLFDVEDEVRFEFE